MIVTTIILTICFSNKESELSEEEIIARAELLGMVMPEESEEAKTPEQKAQELLDKALAETTEAVMPQEVQTEPTEENEQSVPENNTEEDLLSEENANLSNVPESNAGEDLLSEANTNSSNETYELVVKRGDVCRSICETLQENGVIEDAEALRVYLKELGYANNINTGMYDMPYGLTIEEAAQIIMAGPARR